MIRLPDENQLMIVCPDAAFSSWYFNSPIDTRLCTIKPMLLLKSRLTLILFIILLKTEKLVQLQALVGTGRADGFSTSDRQKLLVHVEAQVEHLMSAG